jgi:hypothetical protein
MALRIHAARLPAKCLPQQASIPVRLRGKLRFVRRHRRYYGPVRLPRVVHHRCAAFGLSDAARHTICGRRLGDLPVLAHGDSGKLLPI